MDDTDTEIERLVEEGFFYRDADGGLHLSEHAHTMHPELAEALEREHYREVEAVLLDLWLKGLIEPVGTDDEGETLWAPTELGRRYAEEAGSEDQ